MRVTNGMMTDTVVFNTQRSTQRFMNLQTAMSSGRRINKPSDDPIGTLRDLSYRNEISNIEQYQKNINRAQSWVNTYDNMTADMKNVLSSVKEIAVAMANGNYDATARAGSATEVEAAIDHFLQLGNSQVENRYVLSGNLTQTQPFARSASGITYHGDQGQIEFETAQKIRQLVNVSGSDLLLKPLITLGDTADLNNGVAAATLLSDLNNGSGINLAPPTFTVTDKNRNFGVAVDLTGATTVGDVLSMINARLATAGVNNLRAFIAPTNNAILLKATPDGQVAGGTLLAKLNNGNGVDLSPGKVRVSNGTGVDVQIDLSGALTVTDLLTQFNTQLTAAGVNNVAMTIDPSGTSLRITDTNGVPLGLAVSEMSSNEMTASDLGIVGSISPTLIGTALSPAVSFEIDEFGGTVAKELGILGNIDADKIGGDLDPRLILTTPLSQLQNGLGAGMGSIVIKQGSTSVSLDLSNPALVTVQDLLNAVNSSGLSVTAGLNASGRGIQIANNDPTRSFTIEESGAGRTARNLGLFGASDIMGTLFVLTNALRGDDQEGTGILLRNLDAGMQSLLDSRAEIGSRGLRLETLSSRLDDQKLTFTKRLSEVEDADITELITQLATHENNYRAALNATARIIQPSLMDFLRG